MFTNFNQGTTSGKGFTPSQGLHHHRVYTITGTNMNTSIV